ncbi:MAG: aminodeoxychorismate/anthranilate synthase component II, partial [Blastocatellia bacterium]
MILFVDHRDSFSWNLIAQLRGLGLEVEVCQSEELVVPSAGSDLRAWEAVVFSPGPGHPRDYPNSLALYHAIKGRRPIIGVCLGFQLMLEAEGIQIDRLPEILHGVQTPIRID